MRFLNEPILFWFAVCASIQAVSILIDEFYFHHERGLPKWERIGHPIDTLSVILVFMGFNFLPASEPTPIWFFGLMIFSSFLITKDEWVHHDLCRAPEQWLHSVLFLIHPLVFLFGWMSWKESGPSFLHKVQLLALIVFCVYQVIYWSFIPLNGGELKDGQRNG